MDTYTWIMLTLVCLLSESHTWIHTWSHVHGYLHGSHVYGYIFMEYADIRLSSFRVTYMESHTWIFAWESRIWIHIHGVC